MVYNSDNKRTWWFVSKENMILTHSLFGKTTKKGMGAEDCIEQTYHAYCTYSDPKLLEAVKKCWKFDGKKYRPQRYPIYYEGMTSMSRDHVIYSLLTFIKSGMSKEELSNYVLKLPFRIGDGIGKIMNPELWLWCRLIAGKKIGYLYYPVQLLLMWVYFISNKIVGKRAGFDLYDEDHPSVYNVMQNNEKPERIRKLAKLLYPTYALKLIANMTNVCDDNWFIRKIRKIGLKMTPTYNYVLKQLFKAELTDVEKDDLQNFIPINHDRWSVILNPLINDRPSYRILDYKSFKPWKGLFDENYLDKDYAIWLINNK